MSETAILAAARAAYAAGFSVLPPREDGTKRPKGRWEQYQRERASPEQMAAWFRGDDRCQGLGAVLGKISGNIEMLDFEGRAVIGGVWAEFCALATIEGAGELVDRITDGYLEDTPSGGIHILMCVEGGDPLQNTKLASSATGEVLIETRGEGGFGIFAPSNGGVHPDGGAWELVSGGFDKIETVTVAERDLLYDLARRLDQRPSVKMSTDPKPRADDSPPWERFALTSDQVLEAAGFEFESESQDHRSGGTARHYTRPGKDKREGSSASVWGDGRCTIFSTSVDVPAEVTDRRRLSPWQLHVMLNHDGDFSAAAKAERKSHPLNGDVVLTIDGEPVEPFPPGLRYTDTDNADRFLRLHRDQVRYVMAWRSWLVWDGTVWQRDPDAVLVLELAKDVSRHLYLEIAADPSAASKDLIIWAKACAGVGKIRAMEVLARGMDGVIIDHEDLDANPWAFGVANGWIDLRDGSPHPPDPAKLMTMASPVAFDAYATAPRWDKALEEWLPDPAVRSYFQRLCGEAIVGTVRDHILVLLHGDGGNGKGTAIDTLAKVLGPHFIVPHRSLLTLQRSDTHSTEKAALFRKRLAVAAETEGNVRLAEASVKELTGGDRLGARRLYENPWWFDPTHTLWMQTNHLPEIAGTDEGIWRRVRVMRWPEHFTGDREDAGLREKLADELPGILNWIIAGAIAWQAEGLAEPDAITEASTAYRQEQDQLSQFLEAMGYRLGDQHWCPSKQLQKDWAQWTEAELGRRLGGQVLAQRLQAIGLRKDTGRSPTWRGVGKEAGSQ